ncbi:MAG: flavodoxin family protein [Patescibacteria group bacterium]|nr:flavodoxin family protein [Patescibacteria group bacterium]MDD5715925.1 flavodoxin family protein [Patescibacteria group bacterium]
MKALIIYDSLYGNTEKIARTIGAALGGGTRVLKVNEASAAETNACELLIIGSPTHGGRPSQPMQQFLNQIPAGALTSIRAAAFDTGNTPEGQGGLIRIVIKFFGYASKRIAGILKSKGAIAVAAETFFVLGKEGPLKDGEVERAQGWAKKLITP